ncbi:MAG: hypothetical protein K9K21_11580 [Desulfotignum sp.]|nr:hypothetical protein [Desulfotignum sp.]
METKYICTHTHCSYPGATRFEMAFKEESIMDDNNVATTFCPFCKKEMMPVPAGPMACDTKTTTDCQTAG